MTMNADERTVLVLGANGRFGHAATAAFAAAGWRVLAQARRPLATVPANVHHLGVALDDTDTLARAAAGARVVVHALNPPYTEWQQQVLPLARAGMDLAQRLDARFVLPGNVYNHGESMPALLQPGTAQRPSTAKGRIRCALEDEMRARAATGLRSVVLRAGDFFGGGSGSWLDLVVLKAWRRRKLVYPGPLQVPHAWAYLPDLARACVAVAECDTLPAFAELPFAGHTLTGEQLLDGIERAAASLGVSGPWRRGALPWPLLRAGGLVWPMWREIAEMAYLWRVPHALDGGALADAVGALPSTPIDVALAAALRSLGLGGEGAIVAPTHPRPRPLARTARSH
jgi:nucleoside-diphosphate-sugar epimerase